MDGEVLMVGGPFYQRMAEDFVGDRQAATALAAFLAKKSS